VIPAHRAASITPAVVRASAGAAEHMQIAQVPNLVRCMKLLQDKDRGVWFAGLEATEDATLISETDLTGSIGIVVGSEGKGMRRLTRETCDYLVKLPMHGKVSSLNAGVAGAIAMFEVLRQRGA
jgi:23S rRNA (guanosine2251-2'-O)-methyltransferase